MKRKYLLLSVLLLFALVPMRASITLMVSDNNGFNPNVTSLYFSWNANGKSNNGNMSRIGYDWYAYTFPDNVESVNVWLYNDYGESTQTITLTESAAYEIYGSDYEIVGEEEDEEEILYYLVRKIAMPEMSTYTVRLNPNSVEWMSATLYWTFEPYGYNSSMDYDGNVPAVLDESDGWYVASFEAVAKSNVYVGWDVGNYRSEVFEYDKDLQGTTDVCLELDAEAESLLLTNYRKLEKSQTRSVTIRLDPITMEWDNAYVYVWRGESNYNVRGEKMTMGEDGWWTYSFEMIEGLWFNVGFSSNGDNYAQYESSDMTIGSTSYAYNEDNDMIEETEYVSNVIDETNSITIHIEQAGTFGQQIVQAIGNMSWRDIRKLTVTGSLNKEDLAYLTRMTQLFVLDLSGTDLTFISGCKDLKMLTTVSLPSTCTVVSANAFDNCTRLKQINLDNVIMIGDYAFSYCAQLVNVNMPHVLSIGSSAFAETSVSTVFMPLVTSIGDYAFDNANLSKVDISNAVSLESNAFSNNPLLSEVILCEELKEIPDQCFYNCKKLTNINYPASLVSIGSYALPYVVNTQLPASVEKVGSYNFTTTASVTIPAAIDVWNAFSNTWRTIYNYEIIPTDFDVFEDVSNSKNITVYVPSISYQQYMLSAVWSKYNLKRMTDDAVDIVIDNDLSMTSTSGIAHNATLTIKDRGFLDLNASSELKVGQYIQYIGLNKYDTEERDDGEYAKFVPYTGALVASSAIVADNVLWRLVPIANRWNFFSLPFDVNIRDVSVRTEGAGTAGDVQWVIREYSGANRASGKGYTWETVPANGILKANTGYILYFVVNGGSDYNNDNYSNWTDIFLYTFCFPAVNNDNMQRIFSTNDVVVPLNEYPAEFAHNRSWNLVGNPYPCAFDISRMDFTAPITTWNGNSYTAYTALDDNYHLRPAEAFFVQAQPNTSSITFNKAGRSDSYIYISEDEYYDYVPQRRVGIGTERKVYNLFLSDSVYSDRARLVLNTSAKPGYDPACDAAKMMSSNGSVPQIYIIDGGVRYAIDERKEQDVFSLGVYFGNSGRHTIHLSMPHIEEQSLLLTDALTGIQTDLTEGDYTFSAAAGADNTRFTLRFAAHAAAGIEHGETQATPVKTIENGHIVITMPNGKKYTVGGIEL